MLGQIVNMGKTTKEIPVENLEEGTYYLELHDGKRILRKGFIKD